MAVLSSMTSLDKLGIHHVPPYCSIDSTYEMIHWRSCIHFLCIISGYYDVQRALLYNVQSIHHPQLPGRKKKKKKCVCVGRVSSRKKPRQVGKKKFRQQFLLK